MTLKNLLMFLILVTAFPLITAAQDPEAEKPVEIPGDLREMPSPVPPEEVREVETGIPEIPPSIEERELTPAEKERLAQLEHERAEGDLTDPEYDLEKDVLQRDSNIKF
jgi:hypothetical protein